MRWTTFNAELYYSGVNYERTIYSNVLAGTSVHSGSISRILRSVSRDGHLRGSLASNAIDLELHSKAEVRAFLRNDSRETELQRAWPSRPRPHCTNVVDRTACGRDETLIKVQDAFRHTAITLRHMARSRGVSYHEPPKASRIPHFLLARRD